MDASEPPVESAPKKRRTYPKPTRESKLVTLSELCTLLGLPVAWVKRMSRHGALPCAKIGHRVLIMSRLFVLISPSSHRNPFSAPLPGSLIKARDFLAKKF